MGYASQSGHETVMSAPSWLESAASVFFARTSVTHVSFALTSTPVGPRTFAEVNNVLRTGLRRLSRSGGPGRFGEHAEEADHLITPEERLRVAMARQ
jgi:hypothetical protein